jgi:hypothetical protein
MGPNDQGLLDDLGAYPPESRIDSKLRLLPSTSTGGKDFSSGQRRMLS